MVGLQRRNGLSPVELNKQNPTHLCSEESGIFNDAVLSQVPVQLSPQ